MPDALAHARDAASEYARHVLAETAPRFDFARIARDGAERGLLSASEAERLTLYGRPPEWLARGIAAGDTGESPVLSTDVWPGSTVRLAAPFARSGSGGLTDRFVAQTREVPPLLRVEGKDARHFLRNFCQVSWTVDGVIAPMSSLEGRLLLPYLRPAAPRRMDGITFVGVVEGSAIYTHWLLDTLPRLLVLIDRGMQLQGIDQFLFATVSQGFHKSVLGDLGIPMERVVTRQGEGELIETEAFVHVSAPRNGFVCAHGVYDVVRDFFLPAEPVRPRGRRIFVSRAGAGRRRILNEPELCAYLETRGYEGVRLEDLSIRETARLFAEASHIVAPHGAGLANLVFASPGTHVVEIFGAHLSPEYWTICSQRGLQYAAFEANGPDGTHLDPALRDAMPFVVRNGLDLHVPMASFRAFVETGLS